MSSALLLRERQEARTVRIASVESKVTAISVSRPAEVGRSDNNQGFDFTVDLDEQARTRDSMSVRFSLAFGKRGNGQTCHVHGVALVRFSQPSLETDFGTLGEDTTNQMVVEIFRKSYEPIYLLHHSMGIEAPSPWVTRDVSLFSRGQAVPS